MTTLHDRLVAKLRECETVRGHDLQPDHPEFGSVQRWTCARKGCERAALRTLGADFVYGSATTDTCEGEREDD